ncbi:MAG TPA: hypothetical protein VGV10_03445 [Thermoleophilaceae bacterium]|nr:hypothetical protein [Thermoleophilaceae bacterium]
MAGAPHIDRDARLVPRPDRDDAFLPPSFSGYRPGSPADPERGIPACRQTGARDPGAVELIAYDAHGKQIERVKRDNAVAGVTRC